MIFDHFWKRILIPYSIYEYKNKIKIRFKNELLIKH